MHLSGRWPRIALACLTLCPLSAFATAPADEAAAERVFGMQWKHLARHAGMIFTGTVLSSGTPLAQTPTPSGVASNSRLGRDLVEVRFRIDRPISCVEAGQILTVHEWAGVFSSQPELRSGERVLLLLYPPSRLGLTSPVGGAQGQIRLDSTGDMLAERSPRSKLGGKAAQDSPATANASAVRKRIPVAQLVRALRAARGE